MLIEQVAAQKRTSGVRWWAIASLLILVLLLIGVVVLISRWPFTREAVIDALQESSGRIVEIQTFHKTYFPPGCVAEGVKFTQRERRDAPLIQLQKLIIESSYAGMFHFPALINKVRVVAMHVTVPPKGPDGKRSGSIPLTAGKSKSSVRIATLIADGAVLELLDDSPKSKPYRIEIRRLSLHDVAGQGPFSFDVTLFNPKPPGEIHATGKFGPWNQQDPGQTPVSGSYTYENARLGVFDGISGTLSGAGKFEGPLHQIATDGTTSVADFHVKHSGNTVHLTTEFHARVNGTNGDTFLEPVKAHFWRTTALFEGGVIGKKGMNAKTVELELSAKEGRIEDLFRLFIKAKRSPISGRVSLRGKVEVPPVHRRFLEKLRMQADFGIDEGKFKKAGTQDAINRLSESARGETKKQEDEDPETVLSNLTGHVQVQNGTATFSHLSFSIPGASAQFHGTYELITKKVDLHGTLTTTGRLSDTTSGFKALLVKVITPFLKKKNSAKIVPIKITGTYGNASLGLDLGAH